MAEESDEEGKMMWPRSCCCAALRSNQYRLVFYRHFDDQLVSLLNTLSMPSAALTPCCEVRKRSLSEAKAEREAILAASAPPRDAALAQTAAGYATWHIAVSSQVAGWQLGGCLCPRPSPSASSQYDNGSWLAAVSRSAACA